MHFRKNLFELLAFISILPFSYALVIPEDTICHTYTALHSTYTQCGLQQHRALTLHDLAMASERDFALAVPTQTQAAHSTLEQRQYLPPAIFTSVNNGDPPIKRSSIEKHPSTSERTLWEITSNKQGVIGATPTKTLTFTDSNKKRQHYGIGDVIPAEFSIPKTARNQEAKLKKRAALPELKLQSQCTTLYPPFTHMPPITDCSPPWPYITARASAYTTLSTRLPPTSIPEPPSAFPPNTLPELAKRQIPVEGWGNNVPYISRPQDVQAQTFTINPFQLGTGYGNKITKPWESGILGKTLGLPGGVTGARFSSTRTNLGAFGLPTLEVVPHHATVQQVPRQTVVVVDARRIGRGEVAVTVLGAGVVGL